MASLTNDVKFAMIEVMKQGQVGLLLLIIVGVVVALVMSIASRSLSDTMLSRQERESSAAFAVAETGVEKALNSLRAGGTPPSGDQNLNDSTNFVTGNYRVDQLASFNLYVKELQTAQLDLVGHNPVERLVISWTKTLDDSENIAGCNPSSGGAPAGIEVIQIHATTPPPIANYAYYAPYGCSNMGGFLNSQAGNPLYHSKIEFTVDPLTTIVRIKPIYSGATISVSGSSLHTQLYLVKSKASGGDAQKEIEVTRGLDAAPSIFDFALFSGSKIVK